VAMVAEESEGARVSVKEENAMAHWGGDKWVTHTRLCACTLACVHPGTGGVWQWPWQ
jgi:hypothetical protein